MGILKKIANKIGIRNIFELDVNWTVRQNPSLLRVRPNLGLLPQRRTRTRWRWRLRRAPAPPWGTARSPPRPGPAQRGTRASSHLKRTLNFENIIVMDSYLTPLRYQNSTTFWIILTMQIKHTEIYPYSRFRKKVEVVSEPIPHQLKLWRGRSF